MPQLSKTKHPTRSLPIERTDSAKTSLEQPPLVTLIPPERAIRQIISDAVYPGTRIKMVISLPKSLPLVNNQDPKRDIRSGDPDDDLESTSKGDLTFSLEGSIQ
jgi:hypothetical protein